MLKEKNNSDIIIKLLEEKNAHLEMFLSVSEKERKAFKARNFENLEFLYQVREDILDNVRTLDAKIEGYSLETDKSLLTEEDRGKIVACLAKREQLTHQILEQDLVILSCVDNEKSNMLKKMSNLRDGRRLVKAYRALPDIVE